jgi:hypothetical protein
LPSPGLGWAPWPRIAGTHDPTLAMLWWSASVSPKLQLRSADVCGRRRVRALRAQ